MKSVYCIRRKDTGEIWKANSGKYSWNAPNHAKSAWACSMQSWCGMKDAGITPEYAITGFGGRKECVNYKFDKQDLYEICKMENSLQEVTSKNGEVVVNKDKLREFFKYCKPDIQEIEELFKKVTGVEL